jgi:hypothetical protein
LLTLFDNATGPEYTVKSQQRRHVTTKYTRSAAEMDLVSALDDFRHEVLRRTKGGDIKLRAYGPGIFMTDDILQRIVDAAHANLLCSPQDLINITRWKYAAAYGAEVISLVLCHIPLPDTPAVLAASSAQQQQGSASTRRTVQCSICREMGHNGTSPFYCLNTQS